MVNATSLLDCPGRNGCLLDRGGCPFFSACRLAWLKAEENWVQYAMRGMPGDEEAVSD